MRECKRAKYVVAIFGPVHECDDNFFCWFKEILKRSLVNKVGPVRYNDSEWVLQQAQITLNMIEYVLSLVENTPTTLISRKPGNWREVLEKRMGTNRLRPSPNHALRVANMQILNIILWSR